MAANDLIQIKVTPSGDQAGILISSGDAYFPAGFGTIQQATDPLTAQVRYFRQIIQIQDNGDGTTTPVPALQEIILT